jgi:hypothetical protein
MEGMIFPFEFCGDAKDERLPSLRSECQQTVTRDANKVEK